jgi:hypothetical protein
VLCLFAGDFSNSRIERAIDLQNSTVLRQRQFVSIGAVVPPQQAGLTIPPAYGVKIATTVCTARLVPFTALCATFFAVIAVPFATFLAVRTGPASTLLAKTAKARMIEKNAFMVLKVSSLTRPMRLSAGAISGLAVASSRSCAKIPTRGFSIG